MRRLLSIAVASLLASLAVGCDGAGLPLDAGAPPRARLAAPLEAPVGRPVVLDASAAWDPDGSVLAYTFWPGDGSSARVSTSPELTHHFEAAGAYEVAVVVRDAAGQLARATRLVVVDESAAGCATSADCALGAECRVDLGLCYFGGPGTSSGEAECDADEACAEGTRCLSGLCLAPPAVR